MDRPEISALVALCPSGKLVRNPWQYSGFYKMAWSFLMGHTVLMGREAWNDYPFKECEDITPWIASANQGFQLCARAQFPKVRFTDTLDVVHNVTPPKGIWWVLGGFSVYNALRPVIDCLEATIVNEPRATLDFSLQDGLRKVHDCPNPYDRRLQCARYERKKVSSVQLHHV